jgi:hypothetical protein
MDKQIPPTKRKATKISPRNRKVKPAKTSAETALPSLKLQPEAKCEVPLLPSELEAQRKLPTSSRSSSKLSKVVAMLRAPDGACIADIMKATDWQAHSVRGAIAGAIKKKLGLSVISERRGDERFYRIAG